MDSIHPQSTPSAAGWSAVAFGVLAGLGGLTHAVGEIRQGNMPSPGLLIPSWVEGPIATVMGGEPAMTIFPNLLVTGVLGLIFALATLVWSVFFLKSRTAAWGLIILSIAMLLSGGGVGPPLIGILSGLIGLGIRSPSPWWRTHSAHGLVRILARLWPWLFALTLLNAIFLVIGSLILIYLAGFTNGDIFVTSFLGSVVLLLILLIAARAYDGQVRRTRTAV